MKRLGAIAVMALLLAACNNSDAGKEPATVQAVEKATAITAPAGPPAKVSGVFKGMLPCANCTTIEAILTIKEDAYTYTRLYRGMKTKGSNIGSDAGNCLFENGIVKLLIKTKEAEMFRIVSKDSIRLLDSLGKPFKGKIDYVMVRSSK